MWHDSVTLFGLCLFGPKDRNSFIFQDRWDRPHDELPIDPLVDSIVYSTGKMDWWPAVRNESSGCKASSHISSIYKCTGTFLLSWTTSLLYLSQLLLEQPSPLFPHCLLQFRQWTSGNSAFTVRIHATEVERLTSTKAMKSSRTCYSLFLSSHWLVFVW